MGLLDLFNSNSAGNTPFEQASPLRRFLISLGGNDAIDIYNNPALTKLGADLNSGAINQDQYLKGLAQYDPASYRRIALAQSGVDQPADVKSWIHLNNLPVERREEFKQFRRNPQWLNIGGAFVNPSTQAEIPIGLSPGELPAVHGAQEAAKQDAILKRAGPIAEEKTSGAVTGTVKGEKKNKALKADDVLNLVSEAEKLLPQSTSGLMHQGRTSLAGMVGISTDASKADKRLKVISASLTSNVPRFEGPQGVLDVELYKQAAGDVANTLIPFEDRLAALVTIKDMQNRNKSPGNPPTSPSKTSGLPKGTKDNKDGTFTLPNGIIVRKK